MLAKIISGGQTGVDRAALTVALAHHIPCGGWCPKGRLAEDGRIPDMFPLAEMPTSSYPARTRRNIVDSDATLVIVDTEADLAGGTLLTLNLAKQLGKATLVEVLAEGHDRAAIEAVRFWLHGVHKGHVLNIAGPRESKCPGIGARAAAFLRLVLAKEQS